MSRALLAVAVVALAALGAGCGAEDEPRTLPGRAFPAAVPDGFFGINGQGLRPLAEDGELDLLDRHLDVIAAGGIDFVRANTDWPRIEPGPPLGGEHTYLLDGLDDWVRALAQHGLRWEAVVMGVPTPPWAAHRGAVKVCGSRAAPARAADVAALAAALATRYGRGGTFWKAEPDVPYLPVIEYELWNEPNLGSFWCPIPDPPAYAAVADATADAILAADPKATVIYGGLAAFEKTKVEGPGDAVYSAARFLERTIAAAPALARKLDQIAVHAYGARPAGVLERLAAQRRAVREAGLGEMPITFNETGWYTSGAGPIAPVSEEERAIYLAEVTAAVARSNCGVASFAPHTWITRELNPASIEDYYGIADPETAEPYPTAGAYLDQVLLYEGRGTEAPPDEEIAVCR